MKLSQQGSFLRDDRNKGSQPYVLTVITHNPKYLDQFWMVYMKLSQQGSFLRDDRNKGSQPYVLTELHIILNIWTNSGWFT